MKGKQQVALAVTLTSALLPVLPFGKLPKRLGLQVGVNQGGFVRFTAVRTAFLLSAHNGTVYFLSWCYCLSVSDCFLF